MFHGRSPRGADQEFQRWSEGKRWRHRRQPFAANCSCYRLMRQPPASPQRQQGKVPCWRCGLAIKGMDVDGRSCRTFRAVITVKQLFMHRCFVIMRKKVPSSITLPNHPALPSRRASWDRGGMPAESHMVTFFSRRGGTRLRKPTPSIRVGHVYLDVRRRTLYCLNETARQLIHEGVPLTRDDLQRRSLRTLEGEPVRMADLPLMRAWRE